MTAGPLISVTRFRSGAPTDGSSDGAADGTAFAVRARQALEALGDRDGFLRGSLGRSTDDTADWVLVTEWRDVGSYRRALGNYQVKLTATPLLGEALDAPSSFETLVAVAAGGRMETFGSDREPVRRSASEQWLAGE